MPRAAWAWAGVRDFESGRGLPHSRKLRECHHILDCIHFNSKERTSSCPPPHVGGHGKYSQPAPREFRGSGGAIEFAALSFALFACCVGAGVFVDKGFGLLDVFAAEFFQL